MMHTDKNINEALFGTVMDIFYKTKDNVKARVDQASLCNRPKLNIPPPRDGKKWKKPPAEFVLTKPQRKEVLEWFQTLMFLDGYAVDGRYRIKFDCQSELKLQHSMSHRNKNINYLMSSTSFDAHMCFVGTSNFHR